MNIELRLKAKILIAAIASLVWTASTNATDYYGNFPVTVKSYAGNKTDSTAYSGQIARHLLHNSIKKLASNGNGDSNPELMAQMMAYYSGTDDSRKILSPNSKDGFPVKQTAVAEISKGKDLKGKTYQGAVTAWPGNMTAAEVIEFWIEKASAANKGFDPLTGYDYPQLISKFMMGAVFYNQAVDNYLDERLEASKNPNDKPYKDGTYYSGKEHVWDEAFGYFGAPSHALSLQPKQAYAIAKSNPEVFADADHNGDGIIDLYGEMTYAHAYYAADADKSGTSYLHGIVSDFLAGRQLIASANSNALTDDQRAELKRIAASIKTQWEQVIAEAAFKYAGSVYQDLQKMMTIIEADGDIAKAFRAYAKHWGELKGFAMALQTGGKDLGGTSVALNRLIGYGPVLLGGGQVTGIDSNGGYELGGGQALGDYMVSMIKAQQLLAEEFNLSARKNDATKGLDDLLHSLSESKGAEND